MSTRILLADERANEFYWDAQLIDYKDFAALADDDSILWGDHIHICADESHLHREKEFMAILEDRRWPDVAAWCGLYSNAQIEAEKTLEWSRSPEQCRESKREIGKYKATSPASLKRAAYYALYDAFAAATRGPAFKTDHPCLSRGYHNSIDPGVCKDCGIECSDILCPTCGQTQIVYEDGTLSQPPLGQCWLCHNHYGVNPFTNETQVRHPEREAVLCMDPRPPED